MLSHKYGKVSPDVHLEVAGKEVAGAGRDTCKR